MLRKLVKFEIVSYFDYAERTVVEENLHDTLDIISTLYSDEWCLQMTGSDIRKARNPESGYPAKGRWAFDSSRATVDSIIENFDEVEPNSKYTYYIVVTEP